MEDKIQQARRAAFEAWARKRSLDLEYSNVPGIGQFYECPRTLLALDAFNAALDCVVIELPAELHAYSGQPQDERLLDADRNHAIKLCRAAIESTNLGIKVK